MGGEWNDIEGPTSIPKRLDAELEHSQWLPLSHQCVALVLDRHAWRQPGGRTRRLRGTSDSDCRSLPAMYCTRVQAGGRAKGRARTGWGEGVSGLVAPCSMLFRVHTYPVSGDKSVSSRTPLTLITVLCAPRTVVCRGLYRVHAVPVETLFCLGPQYSCTLVHSTHRRRRSGRQPPTRRYRVMGLHLCNM